MTDFREVYDLYFRDVYRYVLSLSRNEAVAEEVTQETFYKALQKLPSFDGKCKVSVWLCQIAKNTYISMCRKDKQLAPYGDIEALTDNGSMEESYSDKETAFAIHKVLHDLEEYPFWLALYQDRMTYPWKVEMWQYSDKGRVPGIAGDVDMNVYMPG